MIKNISNLGDAALYCDFGNEINKEINTNVISFFKTIQEQNIKGITNLAPSYNKLIISFDLDLINFSDLKKEITKIKVLKTSESLIKSVKIPICCEDEFALDMERLKKKLNLSKNEILNNYLNKEYFCYMTGFVAGMPFLGDIDKRLHYFYFLLLSCVMKIICPLRDNEMPSCLPNIYLLGFWKLKND